VRREIDPFANMSDAHKLVVYCTMDGEPSSKHVMISGLLNQPVDWDEVIRLSGLHAVNAYLYHSLKDVGPEYVPTDVLAKLKNLHQVELTFGMMISAQLSKILKEFQNEDVKIMLLKGAYLDQRVYLQPGFRRYSDMDILVNKRDIPASENILNRLGFTKIIENEKLSESEGRTQVHYQKDNAFLVDLHWKAMNNKWYPNVTRYCEDNIWANARTEELNGDTVLVLSPEDMLIYQCIHLAVHHNFYKLIWFKDIDQIVRNITGIDWESVVLKIKKYRLATYCYYSLYFARELLGTPIPETVLCQLRPTFFAARLFESLLRRENLMEICADRRGKAQQQWMILRDSFWERLQVLVWRNTPSIQWYLHYYPFLPRVKEVYYYLLYPLLMILRLVYRPVDQFGAKAEN